MCHVQQPNNPNKCKQYMPYHELKLIILTKMKITMEELEEEGEVKERGLKKKRNEL